MDEAGEDSVEVMLAFQAFVICIMVRRLQTSSRGKKIYILHGTLNRKQHKHLTIP